MSAAPVAKAPARARTRGPVELAFEVCIGLFFIALFSWFVGLMIEIAGTYVVWKEGIAHARRLVEQDLGYIAAAPRSLLVGDTPAFAGRIAGWVRLPYERVGALGWYERHHGQPLAPGQNEAPPMQRGLARALSWAVGEASQWIVLSMYVAQDVLLRLSVALFALPAFLLACIVGAVDGLVRRDLRRWQGGRESSFVYHHAKRYTLWAMTGGFGLYLSWPFGGFNPAYMVLVFAVLVAATLSTTVATFKKYL
jgi:integrating conjugative element membrane protein (TIGR03747 family)